MDVVGRIKYTKLKRIGQGQGMNSEVFLAHDPQLGGDFAVKEIPKSKFGNNVDVYFAEAQAMFKANHGNIVAIRYACQSADTICLVMPHFGRGSLADRIAECPVSLGEVLRITQGVLLGLGRIHVAKYVHFDVKPSNVLFSDTDTPMVADFGQSREVSNTGLVAVPRLYRSGMPPECIATSTGSPLSDIFQAGLMLYRAVNGDPFFDAQRSGQAGDVIARLEKGTFPNRKRFLPHVPKRIRTLIRKALKVDPAERFQSAAEMAVAFGRVELAIDWTVEALPIQGLRWRGTRPGTAALIVELMQATSGWLVRTFTKKDGGQQRAKLRQKNWRDGLTYDDALTHLEEVFVRIQE